MNGELAYEVDVVEAFAAQVQSACEAPVADPVGENGERGAEFMPLSSGEARRYVTSSIEKLPRQLREASENRERTIGQGSLVTLLAIPVWRYTAVCS